jgi:rhamnose utilization protein RhaD (predicted bifunctional aldolase and dehydrogenase)
MKKDLSRFCVNLSKNPLLVQGAGGNVSWKEANTLFIKASGTCLGDAETKDIFVAVDYIDLLHNINQKNFEHTPKLLENTCLRPSIETFFHAMLSQKFVVHLHAINILSILVQKNARSLLEKILPESIHWIIVDYYKPGAELAQRLQEQLKNKHKTSVIFLRNHGLILAAESLMELENLMCNLQETFNFFTKNLVGFNKSQHQILVNNNLYRFLESNLYEFENFNEEYLSFVKSKWALYPDHVVFLGPQPHMYDSLECFKLDTKIPEMVFIKGKGIYTLEDCSQTKIEQLECYFNLLLRINKDSEIDTLTTEQVSELLNWDAEKYRQNLNI